MCIRDSTTSPPKTEWKNPLLEFVTNVTPNFYKHVQLDPIGPTESPENTESESLVFKLLKRLFEDQAENKELLENLVDKQQPQLHQEIVSGVEKGLKFVSASEAKDLQKLVESFETNLKSKQQQQEEIKKKAKPKSETVKKENRIRSQVH